MHTSAKYCIFQVADGVFYAELNEFLTRELAEDGYAGVEVRVTPARTEYVKSTTSTDTPALELNLLRPSPESLFVQLIPRTFWARRDVVFAN